MQCLICKKHYKHLGSHVYHRHGILARDYKMQFGLDLNYSLIDDDIKEKKRIAWQKNSKQYLKNLEKGEKYRFKKGQLNKKLYTSRQSKERYKQNLIKDKTGICPVCGMKTKHLPSHLYNKHNLIQVEKL